MARMTARRHEANSALAAYPKAYRGYLVLTSPFSGEWWIEKGSRLIGYARDEADARAIIDGLLEV